MTPWIRFCGQPCLRCGLFSCEPIFHTGIVQIRSQIIDLKNQALLGLLALFEDRDNSLSEISELSEVLGLPAPSSHALSDS